MDWNIASSILVYKTIKVKGMRWISLYYDYILDIYMLDQYISTEHNITQQQTFPSFFPFQPREREQVCTGLSHSTWSLTMKNLSTANHIGTATGLQGALTTPRKVNMPCNAPAYEYLNESVIVWKNQCAIPLTAGSDFFGMHCVAYMMWWCRPF